MDLEYRDRFDLSKETMSTKTQSDLLVEPNIEIVKIGEIRISDNPSITIATYSLGSCIGITAYDPQLHLGGIVNYLLPAPATTEKATLHPLVFGSLAIPQFLKALFERNACKERLIVKIAGGSNMMRSRGLMRVGERNMEIARNIFREHDIKIAAESGPSFHARTLRLEIRTGRVSMDNPLESEVEL